MSHLDLSHHFLIAMPAVKEGFFVGALVYVCEHNDKGALGLIINRPTSLTLGEMFGQINIPLHVPELQQAPVYFGGPVQSERGFVLHDVPGEWQSSLRIRDNLAMTTSRDILSAIGAENGPQHLLIALGYAGWEAGQLETEIAENTWLTVPADTHILFDLPPEARLSAAMASLGVDYTALAEEAGHA